MLDALDSNKGNDKSPLPQPPDHNLKSVGSQKTRIGTVF